MPDTRKSQAPAKQISEVGQLGMRFVEGLFVIALITSLAFVLTS